jgi:hypothetical protein
MDERIRIVPGVLHILGLARNFISISKMDDTGVKIVFEKETCRMVRGEMALLKGVRIGTMYKMQGSTISDGCNSSIVSEIRVEEEKTPRVFEENIMLWHQRLQVISERNFTVGAQ